MLSTGPIHFGARVYIPATGDYETVPVYDRYALHRTFRATGPMIIEERESTIVVGPGATVSVDAFASIVIELPQSA
jgi:N-methylhydantoinase A